MNFLNFFNCKSNVKKSQKKFTRHVLTFKGQDSYEEESYENQTVQTLPSEMHLSNSSPQPLPLNLFMNNIKIENLRKKNINKFFKIQDRIGQGFYSSVYFGNNLRTGKPVAVKVISKLQFKSVDKNEIQSTNLQKQFEKEIKLLYFLNNVNIVGFQDFYHDEHNYYVVIEYCNDGNLQQQYQQITSEAQIATIMKQILQALEYIHSHNIIHRDIKPENIAMIYNKNQKKKIAKLIDFGMATVMSDKKDYKTKRFGTPYFIAPEVIEKKYNHKCDIWSLGAILYLLVTKNYPVEGPTQLHLLANIMNKNLEIDYSDQVWNKYSPDLLEFTKFLLNKNPVHRPNASTALRHKWIIKFSAI